MKLKQIMNPKARKNGLQSVPFEFYAPAASTVCISGTFNSWDQAQFPLRKSGNGKWTVSLKLEPGRYEYLFLVDGEWQCDPQAEECVPNAFGTWNCVKTVA